MGLLLNENEFTSKSTSPKLIGETFTTLRTGIIDGAVEQDGSQYNVSDYPEIETLLKNGDLPYITIGNFDEMVSNQGGCDSFGYGTDTEWDKWDTMPESGYVYTKHGTHKVGDPVYDAPGGNIIGHITRIDSAGITCIYYEDTDGTSGSAYDNGTIVDGPEPTTYFKVPKKLGRVLVRSQKPTSGNGYTWYNIYSDGWVEQGKYKNLMGSNVSTTCMLIIPMKDTNYIVLGVYDIGTATLNSSSPIGVGEKRTKSFQMRTDGGLCSWKVEGYADPTEYTKDKWNYQNVNYERHMIQLK